MTARVYRAEDARWLDAPDVLGWWWVLCPDGSVRGVDVTSITRVHAGGAETLTAVCVGPSIPARPLDWRRYRWQRATPPSTDAPDCGTTHHTGCACHEARRDARERDLVAEVKDLRTGLGYFGGRDDERIDALESALRASLARWRAARGRFDPLPHCDVCGVRLAADGTETHEADCAVGRDLRVLGGGAR